MSDWTTPLARLSGIWKSYGGIAVLKGVSIDLHPGEIHALLGGNGAGKSTLMKILTGVEQQDSGEIEIRGESVGRLTPRTAHNHGVYLVPQEPQLFGNLSVLENIKLLLPRAAGVSDQQVAETLHSLGSDIRLDSKASDLSISGQQIVEIARGILCGARVLIVDEPTSTLTAREVDRLFQILRHLATKGVGMFFVSHRMSEIFQLCSRVTVLRDGAAVLQGDIAGVTAADLVAAMVPGHALAPEEDTRSRAQATGPTLLRVNGLTGDGFANVSLEVRAGEVLGVAGVVGSGRTELAETLFGLRKGTGEVEVAGYDYSRRNPRRSLALGLALLPEDRHEHGVFLTGSITDNVSASVLQEVSNAGVLSTKKELKLATGLGQRLAVQAGSLHRLVQNLSGGNQQKISLAKALATKPKVLILDEPSRGIDVAARADLYRLVTEMASAGMGILLISSDFEEIVTLSHRVLVMRDGGIIAELGGTDMTLPAVRAAAFDAQGMGATA